MQILSGYYLYAMYNLAHFKAASQKEVIEFMKAHPFITLCGVDENNSPVATHVPVIIEERDNKFFIHAHVMRKQQHTAAFEKNNNVLCVFSGAHTYVSATWYAKQNEASTWNYQAVHAKGKLNFLGDDELHALLTKLTDTFEGNPHSPASVKNMDKEYISQMMKAIVAFEIEIMEIQHVFKLSQNKEKETYDNIANHLSKGDNEATQVAEIMNERKDKVFPA